MRVAQRFAAARSRSSPLCGGRARRAAAAPPRGSRGRQATTSAASARCPTARRRPRKPSAGRSPPRSAAGGGTIVFSGGVYLTGPIRLASNITLEVDAGAVLRFSSDFDDYLPMVPTRWEGTEVVNFSPLIYGDKVENVAIAGRGLIDGGGEPWWQEFRELKAGARQAGARPTALEVAARVRPPQHRPERVARRSAAWLEAASSARPSSRCATAGTSRSPTSRSRTPRSGPSTPSSCDGVTVRGVTIDNPDDSPNTDGIDPDSCRNVHISDCHINAGDDCIAIKSGRDRQGRRIGRPSKTSPSPTARCCTATAGSSSAARCPGACAASPCRTASFRGPTAGSASSRRAAAAASSRTFGSATS